MRERVARVVREDSGLLVVFDAVKGFRVAVREVFSAAAVVQRCQWHKRENVVGHLPKGEHVKWQRKLTAAYAKPALVGAGAGTAYHAAQLRRRVNVAH